MQVCIITEGGHRFGLGHLTRCLSIYSEFKKRGIGAVLIVNADDSISGMLKGVRYKILDWHNKQGRLFEIIGRPDIAIVDSYVEGPDFYKELRERVKVAVYLDDESRLGYPGGVVVNGSFSAESLKYRKSGNGKFLLGPKYICVRGEFRGNHRKKVNSKIKKVLVIIGGSDLRNLTPKILRLLADNFPGLEKTIVIGRCFKNTKEIMREKARDCEIVFNPSSKKLACLMLGTDIAISAAGLTLYELFRVGVPSVTIAVADNQISEARAACKLGLTEYAGNWKDSRLLNRIAASLASLNSYAVRKRISAAGRRVVDGNGSSRVVEFLIKEGENR